MRRAPPEEQRRGVSAHRPSRSRPPFIAAATKERQVARMTSTHRPSRSRPPIITAAGTQVNSAPVAVDADGLVEANARAAAREGSASGAPERHIGTNLLAPCGRAYPDSRSGRASEARARRQLTVPRPDATTSDATSTAPRRRIAPSLRARFHFAQQVPLVLRREPAPPRLGRHLGLLHLDCRR